MSEQRSIEQRVSDDPVDPVWAEKEITRLQSLADDNWTHYMAWRKRADEAEAELFKFRWKSAVHEPPGVEYATYLVVTRRGDPHTRRMEVWGYQQCYDRQIECCAYARDWGQANGASRPVEFYYPLPEMPK